MSLSFVIMKHVVETFLQEKLLLKFYNVNFIDLPYSKTYKFCETCEKCQKLGSITKRNMMSLNPILEIEIFDYWGIDFISSFLLSFGFLYILVAVDYVSK